MSDISLLLALDQGYETLAAVAAASFLVHTSFSNVIVITPPDFKLPLLSRVCADFGVSLSRYVISVDSPIHKLPSEVRPFFYCIEALGMADEDGRYLYVDADTLCTAHLQGLVDLCLPASRPLAVCSHGRPMYDRQLCLRLETPFHYFNAGVMLFEGAHLAPCINVEEVVHYYLDNQVLCRFREQCVLNALLRDRILFLPSEYNYLSWMRERNSHHPWHDATANPMAYVLPHVRQQLSIVHLSAGSLPLRLPVEHLEQPDKYWLLIYSSLSEVSRDMSSLPSYQHYTQSSISVNQAT